MPNRCEWVKALPVAHRGLHDLGAGVPENSLLAFAKSAEAGYPLELDVRLLADGRVAVFHDETLERMTGAEGELASLDSAGAKALRLAGTDQAIPLLHEALETVAGRVAVFVEIKTSAPDPRPLAEAVRDILEKYSGPWAVESFNAAVLQWFRENAPQAPIGQIASKGADLAKKMPFSQAGFIACHWEHLSDPETVGFREQGIPVLAWTVRTPEEQAQALAHCDNVVFEGFLP